MKTGAQQMFKAISITFLLLSGCRCCFAGPADEPISIGAWSDMTNDPIHGLNLRARLVYGEETGVAGPLAHIVYLDLQDCNSSILNTMYVYYDPRSSGSSLTCELRDASGRMLPNSAVAYDGPVVNIGWLALPYDSILRINATLPGFGKTPDLITAGWNCWILPRGETNDYYLSGTLNVTVPKGETRPPQDTHPTALEWQGTLKLPPVKIPAKSLSGR